MKEKKGIGWILGVPLVVVLLVLIILWNEPERDGISRAVAYKAAALSLTTADVCREEAKTQQSFFAAADQKQWYVKYMDYLYRNQMISRELTPPGAEEAENMLTYEEASYLAERLLGQAGQEKASDLIRMNRRNRTRPFPEEQWWYLYELFRQESEEGRQVTEEVLQIYSTPDDAEETVPWTAHTDQGLYGFEGLGLSRYLDREIRVLQKDGELIRVMEKVSDAVVYRNVWILEAQKKQLSGYSGEFARTFAVEKKLKKPEELQNQLADLYLSKGEVERVVLKQEKLTAKVLAVREDAVELEGYGPVPLDVNFNVYKTYGTFERQDLSRILVGYDAQEFIVADGKLCAALIVRSCGADRIRVMIMDNGFHSAFHQKLELEFLCDGVMTQGDTETGFQKGDTLVLAAGDGILENGRLILTPSDQSQGIRVMSLSRSQGTPVYEGRLEIVEDTEGLILVNELYLEDYLKQVIPSEMPGSYEKEALKAQAVCARTYACRQIRGNTYRQYGAHVDDSTRFQVYNNGESSARTREAVDETYGECLMYEGDVAEAYYFSTSCGHTTNAAVWGSDPLKLPYLTAKAVRESGGSMDLTDNAVFSEYIKGSGSGFETEFSMFRWSTKLTSKTLEQKIPDLGTIRKLTIKERGAGGIARVLAVEGTDGSREFTGESRIRSLLGDGGGEIRTNGGGTVTGWTSLPSAFIAIESSGPDSSGVTTFTIYGGGYGHGVGMSQNAAQAMAKKGWTYREILDFFYKGTTVEDIYGE